MTRFFGSFGSGGGGYGRKSGSTSGAGGVKGESSLGRAMEGRKRYDELKAGGNKPSQNKGDRYQQLVQEKLEAQKAALMSDKKMSAAFQMPGAKPAEREMSKSTKLALELMAERAAKKEMGRFNKKKEKNAVEIKSAYFGGMNPGQLDSKGNLRNSSGKVLLKVDAETGEMRTQGMFGRKVGVYDPKSMSCNNKIAKVLAQDAEQAAKAAQPKGSIYSTFTESDKSSSSSSIYGPSDAGSFWGNKDDDNKGGGWW